MLLHCTPFTISVCLFFMIITPTYTADLINSTCKTCADKSPVLNYTFCVTTLQAIPASHVTNLQGLALIAMELALGNATSTMSKIETMLSSKEYDSFLMECLQDCLELYVDAAEMIASSIGAFLARQFNDVYVLVTAVMDAAGMCEERFTEKEGEVTPLFNENFNLFEIGDIVLCIMHLFSSESHFLYYE